uniref:RRM domain-containing protein n=1 Tax=Globodera pallida TaxID=36090 RepID=A0A183BWH9_GLOPA
MKVGINTFVPISLLTVVCIVTAVYDPAPINNNATGADPAPINNNASGADPAPINNNATGADPAPLNNNATGARSGTEITHNDELSRNDECQQLQDVLDVLKLPVRNLVPLVQSGIIGAQPAPGCFPQELHQPAHTKPGVVGNKMQFSLIILSSLCLYVGALPRLNEPHYKAKHGGERGQKSDAQPQQMPRRIPFPRPGPVPEYLQDASEKAQLEYQQMFAEDNGQTPKGELKAKLAKWAESNGMKKEYDMHQEEYQRKTWMGCRTICTSGSSLMQLMLSHQQPNWQQPQSRKLFIGGLGQVNDDALRQYYSQWGQVVDCIVIRDPATRSSRGFGFVTYATPEMADVAIAHRPHKINGKAVDAKRAVPRERMNLILDNDPIPFFMNIEPDLGCRLHLSGLNWEWHTLDTLRSYFAKFGAVEQLEMVAYPRGCGSLVFGSLNAAQHCLAAGGKHSVNGHPIEVRKK